jgi:pimeloyl-ACP methyl ester carboxylesterase
MREEKISIKGLEVNYKIHSPLLWKKGRSILILHGWGGSSDSWRRVQEILAKRGYQVIVPDFPGFGKSKTPTIPWGIKEYTDFTLNLVNHFELQNFFLLGHSFGGRIAIKFTTSYPEKIKILILCDSAGIKQKWGPKEKFIFRLSKIGNAIFTPAILNRFKDKARNLFYVFLRKKDYVKANGTMKETIKKVLGEDLLPELSQIKTKTLIVWGQGDRMVPVKFAHIFKEKIWNSELIVLPKISHSPHLEVPKKLAEIILKFFD